MPSQPDAFLSYTRTDDEYLGGAITSLRRLLELGVKVVTGRKDFSIFQDIDGIEFGQQWQKRLDQAIANTRFLIPIITPLFFSSPACRDELSKFITHEKNQGRDDLILPIYLVTVPELERSDSKDSLAISISKRERYDLRAKANLRIKSPQMRATITELSNKIATALRREPSAARHDARATTADDERAELLAIQNAAELDEPSTKSKKKRKILWVDDRPNNNIFERRAMQPYGVEFELAKSTGEALAMIGKKKFDAIISDMGRPPDMEAGYTLLDVLRKSGNLTPYFIYAGSDSAQHLRLALSKGAQGSTNLPNKLIAGVLESLDT